MLHLLAAQQDSDSDSVYVLREVNLMHRDEGYKSAVFLSQFSNLPGLFQKHFASLILLTRFLALL